MSIALTGDNDGHVPTSGYYIESGALPPGLAIADVSIPLDNQPRYITGTPTVVGTYTAVIAIDFDAASGGKITQTLTINVLKAQPVLTGTNTLSGTIGSVGAKSVSATLSNAYFNGNSINLAATLASADGSKQIATSSAALQNGTINFSFLADDLNALPAGTYSLHVSAVGDASNLDVASVAVGSLAVTKQIPTVLTVPVARGFTFKGNVGRATLVGGTASVDGTFVWTDPDMIITGGGQYPVTFMPTDADTYASVPALVKIFFDDGSSSKQTPTIVTDPTGSDVVAGTSLWNCEIIGGEASVNGSFAWSNFSQIVRESGGYEVTFMPADGSNYRPITTTAWVKVVSKTGANGSTSTTLTAAPILSNGKNLTDSKIDTTKDKYTIVATPTTTDNGRNPSASVTIPYETFITLQDSTKTHDQPFQIEIQAPFAIYQVPVDFASLIPNFDQFLSDNNLKPSDVGFKFTMTDQSENSSIQKALEKELPVAKVLGAIVDFKVEIINNGTSRVIQEVTEFTQPIVRLIALDKTVKMIPGYFGVRRYNETTAKFEFVPHKKMNIGDVWYAQIPSKSNSTYMITTNHVTFTDVKPDVWYTSYIEQAAAKGLVIGVGNDQYQPSRVVTRAEFVQMIVNALQLPEPDTKVKAYLDVSKGSFYYDTIAKAKSAGLLNLIASSTTGNFYPNQPITREEMAGILSGAVQYENIMMTDQYIQLDSKFTDYNMLDEAYQNSVQTVYKLNIMKGTSASSFDPTGLTTRAQAAVVLMNMTKAFGMID